MPTGPGAPNLSGISGFSGVAGITAGAQGGVATTTGITSATQLTAYVNEITTSTSNAGVMLPPGTPGLRVTVINDSANTITVFGWIPQNAAGNFLTGNGDTIEGSGTTTQAASTTGVTLATGKIADFVCFTGESGNTQGGGFAAQNVANWKEFLTA